ncbi:MAG: DNA-directed RNA polymerase subunit delta [Bacilli bacterium]|nr:DNA-directed RNA polymerase subunit delta [Bacilli bacterium]
MKTIKLTSEQIEQMSYTDVANLVLKENGKKMKIQDLFQQVIKLMQLPDSYFESKIGDFFGLLSTDKRFTMLEKGFWDLAENHSKKVIIDDDEEEEEIETTEIDDIVDDEEIDDVNYDDDTVDDDEDDDDLKDLVIMDDGENEEMM